MQRSSLLLIAPRQLQWFEEELPAPAEGEVLVQTIAGAISLGSEIPQYRGDARGSHEPGYPRMTGYESVGVVCACGPGVSRLHVGDRVVATYGHRTAAIVPEARAIPVPVVISDELALLAILSCDVAKGIRKLQPRYEETALVTGAGTIGLLTVWMLAALGLKRIDVIDPDAARRDLALVLGARATRSPDSSAAGSVGYSVGFECSGRDAGFALLQADLGPNARICVLSDGNLEPLTLTPAFHEKELEIVGSSDGWDYQEHARWYFEAVRRDFRDLERIFDRRIAAADLPATFEQLATDDDRPVKVFVRYESDTNIEA